MSGKELRTILNALGISYSEVAKELGYTTGAVKQWVSRNVDLPKEALPKIVKFIRSSIEQQKKKHSTATHILQIVEARYRVSRS